MTLGCICCHCGKIFLYKDCVADIEAKECHGEYEEGELQEDNKTFIS